MSIIRTRIDLSDERRILMHMITSTDFLTQLKGIGEARYFESGFARLVAGWVWEFHAATSEAPGRAIKDIYLRKAPDIKDEAQQAMVAEFLTTISNDWAAAEPTNTEYSTRTAIEFFKLRSLAILKEKLDAAITARDWKTSEKLVGEYRRISRPGGSRVDMLSPDHASRIAEAFTSMEEALFRLPGALGEVVGPIIRGDFVGIVAPPKRGKSWMADWFAQRAGSCGLKTLVVNLEMTESQMIRRRWQMLTGRLQDRDGTVNIPEFKVLDADRAQNEASQFVVEQTSEAREGVGHPSINEIMDYQRQIRLQCRGTVMHLECMSGGSLTVSGLRTYLRNAESYDGICYDVVVIDAPYLMEDESGNKELRHRLDAINKGLRSIAQEFSLAMIVTHQGDASTMDGKKDVKAGSTSESKVGLLSHYTKMIGLNQKPEEKKVGIMRVSCDITRDGAGTAGQAVVLQCLAIGRPYLDSKLWSEVAMALSVPDR